MASKSKKTPKTIFSRQILANVLIISGAVLLFTVFFLTQFSWISNALAKNEPIQAQVTQPEIPAKIAVGRINLEVVPGEINQNQWDLSPDKAVFLKTAGQINQNGNIVIYGHDTLKVFGNLASVSKKDTITLTSNSGKIYTYQIDTIKTVWPNDLKILDQPTDKKQLTLFTCSGLFDSQRLVIVAHEI